MVECDYCGKSFGDEDGYLDHLETSHGDQLSAIDQRRVDSRKSDDESSGVSLGVVAAGVVLVLVVGAVVYVTQLGGGGENVSPDGIEAAELNESGAPQALSSVEEFPSEGRDHVDQGTDIEYNRTPPLSGTHYKEWSEGGYFEEEQEYGNLVHALEHGAVVVYYAPGATDQSAGDDETAEESLREFSARHSGQFRNVVVVPNPEDDPEADFVVTAWRYRLYMDDYDPRTLHAFISEHLGRGPEQPVR